ncbi:response regulator [Flavobacteriaceae bacterium TP-CH-4]|uniref:histidine kinase n=1 Tax=Pelagihabitans pacificus TaxID=2696054 RepID=A0A967ASL7_9FLAO|nr:ATP-binding protein [Pelagihabitans pacificus]NHF58715.1 response regulator [Pelagihabitans pacificus]
MKDESKNRFTFKIIFSYLVLAVLFLVAGYFIYSEIRVILYNDTAEETDIKLLKTGALVTELYEAESLSKLALQNKTQANFNAYAAKIDTLSMDIDTLKQLSGDEHQKSMLDSVQLLLRKKVDNSNELRNLKVQNEANNSIDIALKEFRKMESSFGKLTAYDIHPNPESLSSYERKVLEDWVTYLNDNIPADSSDLPDSEKIDSIINASRVLLVEAKMKDAKTQRFLAQKEEEINRNDLELSQQLRTIISAFEQEVLLNSYNQSLKRQAAFRKSMRLAGFAAVLGFLVVALFTFLINRDFWRIQTYRQKLEKEKKFSESLLRSREQLISTVSHDLRTPLNTITGYTELMESTPLSEKQKQYLKNVKSSSEYVNNLVNDLLDFSKLEAGKLKVEKVPFIAAHLIQETAENLQALYSHKKLSLFLEIDPELKQTVSGDPFRIRQVLTNLIGNAFKFTEEGSIKIRAKAIGKGKNSNTHIEIQDTGIGIPKEKQQVIFKEFAQGEDNTDKKFGGYGLGLTISKKLTELLGGSLQLESEFGRGSTFILKIPLEITKIEAVEKTEAPYMAPKLRMLIIDDDTALLRMLKELTGSMGIRAHIFSNFLQVEKESHLAYDLVLTDIQMPQITGFEVLQRLRAGEYKHYKNQPIIAMTGRRDLESEAYTSLGFAQVLQKPFSKGELIGILKLLGLHTKNLGKELTPKEKTTTAEVYDLDIIHSFLGTNEDAIHDVLETFLMDTSTNMKLLNETVTARDYAQINSVAHRMLPMFRQLKVASCVPILERLEVATPGDMDAVSLDNSLRTLKESVVILIVALENRLATSPTYND